MLTTQAFLAAVTGPDGLIYAIGGESFDSALNTVEVFTITETPTTAPDPYIGNGTYQSPDIILLDSSNNPIPIGGKPGGAWDTLLQPNTYYGIEAVVYNDSPVAAANTSVRFWHFPGGVGTAGALIDHQTVTVPANGSMVVQSANPFESGAAGQHECVAVSVANPQSAYFATDPTTAAAVPDPTIPHPTGSSHFGSAWRNTDSVTMGMGQRRLFPFQIGCTGREPVQARVLATATKVPEGWEREEEPARIRRVLESSCGDLRLPLFLVPALRSNLPVADLRLEIEANDAKGKRGTSHHGVKHHITVKPGEARPFTVSATIPHNVRVGEIFLLNVAAHYPAKVHGMKARVVEYLEVIYVKQ